MFHVKTAGEFVKNQMKISSEVVGMIQRGVVKWARLRFFTYQTTDNTQININSIKVKQMGMFSRGQIDTSNKNFYIRINKGELYDTGIGTESVYNTFRHILENYDGIDSSDIDYDNLSRFRSLNNSTLTGWDVGRQVTKTKNSMLYLDELCKQSMVGMFQTRDNKLKLKAFNEDLYEPDIDYPIDDTVATFSDDTNIIRNSEKAFQKTPLNQTYNEFFLQFGLNPASKEYDKEITVTKTNEASFPDFYEPSTGANTVISDSYALEQIILMTSGEATVTFSVDVSGVASIGDTISLIGYNEGYAVNSSDYLQYGRLSAISEDGKVLTINNPTDWTESDRLRKSYNGGSVIKHTSGSLPKWKTFTSGFSSYAEAKNFWNTCHESYLKSGVVRKAPGELTKIDWYTDQSQFNDKTFFKGVPSGSSPYLLLKDLVEWTVFQKAKVKFNIPLNSTYIVRDLLDFVLFKDIILTNDVEVDGWIIGRSLNLKKDTIELEVLFRPILDELINIIQETGSADDIIQETGSSSTIIQET